MARSNEVATERRVGGAFGFLFFIAAVAAAPVGFASCSSSDGSGGGAGHQGTSDGSGGTGATSAGGSGQAGSTSSEGGGGGDVCAPKAGATINGCKADGSDATDLRGMGPATIEFGMGSFVYDPKCLLVDDTQTVSFDGDFTTHPLGSGEVRGGAFCPDKGPLTYGGATPKEFTLTAGTYPYYCKVHGGGGMNGLVIVKAAGGSGGGGGSGGAGGN